MPDSIKVMIVDDHPVFRQGLRNVLAVYEDVCVVGEATDGPEAIERAQELLPDVVVMDINLPTLNGLQATRRLKALCPQINVIMLTARDSGGGFGLLCEGCQPRATGGRHPARQPGAIRRRRNRAG